MRLFLCCVLCFAAVTAIHTGDLKTLKQKPQEQALADKGDPVAVEKGTASMKQDVIQQADPVTAESTVAPVTTQAPVEEQSTPPQNAQPAEPHEARNSKPQNHEPSLPSTEGTNNWLSQLESRFVNPSSNQSTAAARTAFSAVLKKLDLEENDEEIVAPETMSMGRIERTTSLAEEKLGEEVERTQAPLSAILSAVEKADLENIIGVDSFRKIDELNLEGVPDLTRELSFKLLLVNTRMLLKQSTCQQQYHQTSSLDSSLTASVPVNADLSPITANAPANVPANAQFSPMTANAPTNAQVDPTLHDMNLNKLNTQSRSELESQLKNVRSANTNNVAPIRSQAMVNTDQKTIDLEKLSIEELQQLAFSNQNQRQTVQQQTSQQSGMDLNTLAYLHENDIPLSYYNQFRSMNSPIVQSSQASRVNQRTNQPALRWASQDSGYDLDDLYKLLYLTNNNQPTFVMSGKNKAKKTKSLEKSGLPAIKILRSLVKKTKKASEKE